jgi:hypothetical protein
MTGCETPEARGHQESTGIVAGSGMSSQAGTPSGAEALPRGGSSGVVSSSRVTPSASGQAPMDSGVRSANQSTSADASLAADASMPSASSNGAMDAAQTASNPSPPNVVHDLSDQVLAMWGSSVCDGYMVPSGAGWPWKVEKKFAEIHGPKVLQVSTVGHTTDSKESTVERNKVKSANFVVICLSLGNQNLSSATTDASAQSIVDAYLDDIFTDDSDTDGDPVSLVNYIKSLGAYPIVALVYPMAEYNTMHCRHVVEANILQQAYGIPTINHLGPTNAGNDFGDGDCTWANGSNAPVNVQSDVRHPNEIGHDENFYAFPLDLPFALASEIPFPVRPTTTDYMVLAPRSEPIRYTPEYAMHNYTMQFAFQASGDGTLAAIDLGMNGFLTIEVNAGTIRLVTDDGADALLSAGQVTDSNWHDVALTYSYVRQKLVLYVDGALVGEHDARASQGNTLRELFPQSFILGGPATSGRPAAPAVVQLRDLFINRTSLHSREVEERAKTDWVGAGSLDIYAPLRASAPAENRAQTLQTIKVQI